MSNDVWWDNVKFRDFCSHFINMTPEEIAADIKESLVKLIQLDDSGDSFGAMMVKNAKLRQGSPKSEASRQNGIKGGRPKKSEKLKPQLTEMKKTPDQLVWGKFENVFLTQEQFNELARNVGNLNKARELVENLSAGLADGSKESKNHFATLTHWANYRKSKAEEEEISGTRYESVTEHNRRVSEKADREIRQMKEMGLI